VGDDVYPETGEGVNEERKKDASGGSSSEIRDGFGDSQKIFEEWRKNGRNGSENISNTRR